ncbi:FUSC family protein [Kistimonas scapharcae]|uniref:FUSC family protein n=1 Tax=Kistimonas scapharcae TaxID=1036133 RepID=A0ABP8V3P4_9GAMM
MVLKNRLAWLVQAPVENWIRVLQIVFGMGVIEWCSYRFNLASPGTALVACIIVAQPLVGMIYAKAANRVLGTLFGCLFSLFLLMAFGQAPVVFFALLVLWVCVMTWLGNRIWRPLEYTTRLSGYTVAMVAVTALAAPDNGFILAVHRMTDTLVGVLVMTVISTVVVPLSARELLRRKAWQSVNDVLVFLRQVVDGLVVTDLAAYRKAHMQCISGSFDLERMRLDASLENLSRGHVFQHATALVQNLLRTVSRLHVMAHQLAHLDQANTSLPIKSELMLSLQYCVEQLETLDNASPDQLETTLAPLLTQQLEHLALLETQLGNLLAETDTPDAALWRITLTLYLAIGSLESLQSSLRHMQQLHRERPDLAVANEKPRLAFHVFHRLSLLRALRPAVAIGSGLVIWYWTAWPQGASLMMMPIVLPTLFAAHPFPALLFRQTIAGIVLGMGLGYLMLFRVMPVIDGFPLFFLAQVPVIVIAGLLICNRATVGLGMVLLINFYLSVQPTNMPVYDFPSFVNLALATLTGSVLGCLSLLLVFPESPRRIVRSIHRQMLEELAHICENKACPEEQGQFESRMYDRLNQVQQWMDATPRGLNDAKLVIQVFYLGELLYRFPQRQHSLPAQLQRDIRRFLANLAPGFRQWAKGQGQEGMADQLRHAKQQMLDLLEDFRTLYPKVAGEDRLCLLRTTAQLELIPGLLERMAGYGEST